MEKVQRLKLQELLDSVADDLDRDVDYIAKLFSGGFRTPNVIRLIDRAEDLEQACGLLSGDAAVIWQAAHGIAGTQLAVSLPVDERFIASHYKTYWTRLVLMRALCKIICKMHTHGVALLSPTSAAYVRLLHWVFVASHAMLAPFSGAAVVASCFQQALECADTHLVWCR